MSQIIGIVMWVDGHFIRCAVPRSINCALLTGAAQVAYLLPPNSESGQDEYTLSAKNPKNDPSAIKGILIQENGIPMLVDVATAAEIVAGCDACCDDANDDKTLTPVYNGVFPGYISPLAATYTVARTDGASYLDAERFQIDYMNFIIPGSWLKVSVNAGVTTYSFQSFRDPIKVGSDTITETPRVFTSNALATPGGANVYQVKLTADGGGATFKGATTLAGTVTALNADATMAAFGTWSTAANAIVLTTTLVNAGVVAISSVAP